MVSTVQSFGRALILGVAALVAGCSAVPGLGDASVDVGTVLAGPRDLAAEQASAQAFARVDVCPTVQVRDGTQLLRIFERGKQDDLGAVRFQASIQKFARECRADLSGATVIKVGVAGRVLSGPSAATGDVSLPVRVVLVKNGDEVLYSQLHTATASVTATTPSVLWNQVVDGLTIPPGPQANYIIYVGFDETAPGKKRS